MSDKDKRSRCITDIRVGSGLDFHRLAHDPQRPLILGGYTLPDEDLALTGHSDADLVLHALSDAILGALGLGDIGAFFPDTNPELKGMDSRIIAEHALEAARKHGYQLSNMDITIIGERPKILPHRQPISASLSSISGLALDRIGIKATTTEKMGALGRKEGTGALVSVTLVRYDR